MTGKKLSGSLLLLFLAAWAPARDSVRVVGSDLLGAAIRPALETAAEAGGWSLEFDFSGSLASETALQEGSADIAILALPRDNPPREGFQSWPMAFEVTTLVVHESNPIQELSLEQVRKLFAEPSGESELNWGAVGGEGPWSARPVTLHAVRERNHLDLELFRSTVLGPREMRVNVRYWDSDAEMLEQIGEDSTALGICAEEEVHPQVRSLFLALRSDSQAYNATPQSVYYGDYPLRLAFYAVVPEGASADVAEVVRFLFSEEMAAVLEKAGYVPVPETERRQFQMDLDFGS